MPYKFFESICYKNRKVVDLPLHQRRLERTFRNFFFRQSPPTLKALINIPQSLANEQVKIRFSYDSTGFEINYIPYNKREITSLALMKSEPFDYGFKYSNRRIFESLTTSTSADDVIIAIDGRITDASYANLIFKDGNSWYTPNSYLLNGVKRQCLLEKGLIKEVPILVEDIKYFESICLINAMMDIGETELPISGISGL